MKLLLFVGFFVLVCSAVSEAMLLNCGNHVLSVPGVYQIRSPNYPGDYPNNAECVYNIQSGQAWPLKLNCSFFDVESHSNCSWDWLEVNGVRYCGTSGPPTSEAATYDIVFHSDYNVRRGGYECNVELTDVIPCNLATVSLTQPGTYQIQSPGYPSNYPDDQVCDYSIESGLGWPLKFSCSVFDIEFHSTCNWDWLEVNGTKYCGTSGPPASEAVSNNISFRSDYIVTRPGYVCSIELTDIIPCYGHTYDLPPGSYRIQSLNHPDLYPNNAHCKWILNTAQCGDIISLNGCTAFDVEASATECAYDRLDVGGVWFCGTTPPPVGQARTQNFFQAEFVSDYSMKHTGFSCEVLVEHNPCCGRGTPASRIVNGSDAAAGQIPWQAGLVHVSSTWIWCGGALISPQFLLTAAHCVEDRQPEDLQVLLGELSRNTTSGTEQRLNVSEITVHGGYSEPLQGNDFAVLRLAAPAQLDDYVSPVCLPPPHRNFSDVEGVISGWGRLYFPDGPQPDLLQYALVQIYSQSDCQDQYNTTLTLLDSMVCAAGTSPARDACNGDSGGPLTAADCGRTMLVGLTSFGVGSCANLTYPGVYARVSDALKWVTEVIGADVAFC